MDVAIRPDQGRELDPLAADISDKIAEDRERGDCARAILRLGARPPGTRPAAAARTAAAAAVKELTGRRVGNRFSRIGRDTAGGSKTL